MSAGAPDAGDAARATRSGAGAGRDGVTQPGAARFAAGDIARPDPAAAAQASARQAQLTKPAGALGRLEEVAIRFAGWQRRGIPVMPRVSFMVFAADHGVAASRAVSAYPPAVTAQMAVNIAHGGAAIAVAARALGASLAVVDVGIAGPVLSVPGLVSRRVRYGTADLAVGAAMSAKDVDAALAAGAETAREAISAGAGLLVPGEMGIGNTTAAAALVCALTGAAPMAIVGRGTGIDDAHLVRKRAVVAQALARCGWGAAGATAIDGRQALAELGGLEIAAMSGAMLSGAAAGVPVLLDGFIAAAAALVARAIDPRVADWWLAGHRSAEAGHRHALDALGLAPLLDLDLRLGEGSGAAVAVPVIRMALTLHAGMATFAEAAVAGPAAT